MLEYRAATVELFGDRALQGVAVPFNRRARLPSGRYEIWAPGSAMPSGDAILNAEHLRGAWLAREPDSLAFELRADGLHWRCELPDTSGARDALELVRARIYRGASVEFRAQRERTAPDGTRVIVAATVNGLALAARPIFADTSVEARAAALARVSHLLRCETLSSETLSSETLENAARSLGLDVDALVQAATADEGAEDAGRALPDLPLWVLS